MIRLTLVLTIVTSCLFSSPLNAVEVNHQRFGEIYFAQALEKIALDFSAKGEVNGDCHYVEFDKYPSVSVMVIDGIIQRVDIQGAAHIDKKNLFYKLANHTQSLTQFKQQFPYVEVYEHEYLPGVYLHWYNEDKTRAMVVDYVKGQVDMVKIGLVPATLWVEGCA